MAHRGSGILKNRFLLNPCFAFCLLSYLFFRVMLWAQPALLPKLVVNYFADVVCLPIVLTLAVLLQRFVVLRQPGYVLTKWQVLFAIAYFSLLFEGLFPVFLSRYTSDPADVAAYAAGAAIYWRFIQRESFR